MMIKYSQYNQIKLLFKKVYEMNECAVELILNVPNLQNVFNE